MYPFHSDSSREVVVHAVLQTWVHSMANAAMHTPTPREARPPNVPKGVLAYEHVWCVFASAFVCKQYIITFRVQPSNRLISGDSIMYAKDTKCYTWRAITICKTEVNLTSNRAFLP